MAIVGEGRIENGLDFFEFKLTTSHVDCFSVGIDEQNGRPTVRSEHPPHHHVSVVHDGMFDLVAKDGLLDVVVLSLLFEFGGVNTDDDEFLGKFVFQFLQFRKNVKAVDAAIGPEVQQHEFAFQVGQRQRPLAIHPRQVGREIRNRNLMSKWIAWRDLFANGWLPSGRGFSFLRGKAGSEAQGEN